MGIRGLQTLVNGIAGGVITPEIIPSGSLLIVDGDGFIFHILRLVEDSAQPLLGGDYGIIDSAIRSEINLLRDTMGFALTFYFGGKSDIFKDGTILKRIKQREEKWFNVYSACRDCKPCVPDDAPIPALSIDQMLWTLADLGISMIQCDGESDQIIASAVFEKNKANPGSTFCYGQDSDFLVMKDCPYIEFGKIKLNGMERSQTLDKSYKQVSACVFRRSATASLLGLSDSQLVELAIAAGNDFTECYSRTNFRDVFGTLQLEDFKYIGDFIKKVLESLRELDAKYRVSSSNRELDLAIRYSRLFYNLFDVSGVVLELQRFRDSINYEAPSTALSVNISTAESNNIKQWFSSKSEENPGLSRVQEISAGRYALQYLQQKKDRDLNGDIVVRLNNCDCVFLQEHIEAISVMMSHLEGAYPIEERNPAGASVVISDVSDGAVIPVGKTADGNDANLDDVNIEGFNAELKYSSAKKEIMSVNLKSAAVKHPVWNNVVVGYAFQSIVSKIIKIQFKINDKHGVSSRIGYAVIIFLILLNKLFQLKKIFFDSFYPCF